MSEEPAEYRTESPGKPKRGIHLLSVDCTEVHRASSQGRSCIVGYVIDWNGRFDAYGRSASDDLLFFGSFDDHDEAHEAVMRST